MPDTYMIVTMNDEEMATYSRRHDGASNAMTDIWRERIRQIEKEGWTPEHDDQHRGGGMIRAACCYAMLACGQGNVQVPGEAYQAAEPNRFIGWPWARKWWKPKNPRRDLVRAAALIVAEIERLDRQSAGSPLKPAQDVGDN